MNDFSVNDVIVIFNMGNNIEITDFEDKQKIIDLFTEIYKYKISKGNTEQKFTNFLKIGSKEYIFKINSNGNVLIVILRKFYLKQYYFLF